MDEKNLILLAKAGDKEAFCSLYSLYKGRLYRYAFYKLQNEEDAKDCLTAPRARHPEVKHVRDAVLRPAEDEAHHAEEQREILPDLVGVVLVALHGNVDEDVTQKPQEKEAHEAVVQLGRAQRHRLFRDARVCIYAIPYREFTSRNVSRRIKSNSIRATVAVSHDNAPHKLPAHVGWYLRRRC